MALPVEESSILNDDIENDVTSSHRNLVINERGNDKLLITITDNIAHYIHKLGLFIAAFVITKY